MKKLALASISIVVLFLLYNGIIIYSISENIKQIDNIKNEQLELLTLSEKLTDRLNTFSNSILAEAVLGNHDTLVKYKQELYLIENKLKSMKSLSSIEYNENTQKIIQYMNNRVISYSYMIDSIVEAMKSEDKKDLADAVYGFNNISQKFISDSNNLMTKVIKNLEEETKSLKDSLEADKIKILISPIFIIFFLFLAFLLIQKSRLNEELRKRLYYDDLTTLPNRNRLLEDIDICQNYEPVMALINIDDFKSINDFYGTIAGDKILKEFAIYLQNLSIQKDLRVYRVFGDEFAVLNKYATLNEFEDIIEELINETINHEFEYEDSKISFNVTVGIAKDSKSLLVKADSALEYAKSNKLKFLSFSDDLMIFEQHKNNLEWIHKLKYAIKDDNIMPFFQPIINNSTGEIEKYECLIRIVEGDNIISPYCFLDISKKSKQYSKLTKIMIEKSFKVFKENDYEFSLNFSMEDITNEEIVKFLFEQLEDKTISHRLVIELLESENIDDFDEVVGFIDRLKEVGVKVAIDDFGSGYSNFGHLLKLKVDYIKIDGSLIKNITTSPTNLHIVKAIVNFTKGMQIKCVAEFVHSDEVYERVKELGIDYSQGFYLGEPRAKLVQ